MTLSTEARHYMALRKTLVAKERGLIENVFLELYESARDVNIPAAKNDRAAELEAAIIKFIIDSREG